MFCAVRLRVFNVLLHVVEGALPGQVEKVAEEGSNVIEGRQLVGERRVSRRVDNQQCALVAIT